ncbi:HAD-IC family P-type ATPase [Hornefia butyriciproducens]|uniref:HAD-IC family P-type ATPase n=1 Tax=Hornefia butyriciproducens TaxID=2652293 RepID=UPI003D03F5C4
MTGLTTQEVQERIKQGKVNEEVSSSTRSVNEIVKSNIFTYFNLIFTVLAVLLIVVGSFKDLSFMLIIFANTGIGIYQEIRSKNTLDNLKFSKMPRSIAIRDGRRQEVDTDRLVLGDVVVLGAGNQIPADARVEDGSVSVNEALITGESDEIEKHPGDELMSGSFVVSGECAARLTAVGKHSYINRLTAEATRQKKNDNQSQMVKSLDRLVMFIGVAIIPIGGILMFQQIAIQGLSFRASVIAMVAAVLGMIPEGLYMMASIAMVVSAMRLAQSDVLVQNMRCIETLARVDVLCVDKTGTITENEMQVAGLKSATKEYSEEALRPYIADLAQSQSRDNITMAALQNYFTDGLGREPFHVCGFSSKYKYCGASYEDGNFVLGAPEFVLGENFSRYSEYIQSVSEQGYRVLAFARSREEPRGQTLTEEVRLLALILLVNPIREGAKPTFEYFAENGVDVKVISGDNPVTVSNVAQEAGIADAQNYVDARTLKSQDDVDRAVGRYTVFGRVTPEQKRMFVKGLQKQGKTVGMTGDGVNDILALRDADISIAMASGSEAASNAAQLVLMDSDFSRMPLVVAEGRRVVNNIIKTATLYLTKNIFSLLLAMFSLISVLQYPLKPSQITLISMFTIGIPSFVLSLEPNRDRIRGSFLGNVFRMATPAGITLFLSVSCLLVFGDVLELKASMISTASSALVALVEFMILARVAKPMNRLHLGMMVVMVAGFFYMIIFHNSLFGISPVNWQCALLLVVFMMATEAVFRYFYKFTAFVENFLGREARQRKRH